LSYGIHGSRAVYPGARSSGQAPGASHRKGGLRDAAQDVAGQAEASGQAQGVPRAGPPACGATAQTVYRHSVEGNRMTATPQFRWQAVGRRKTSVARVYLTPGTGKWDINGRTLGDYFPRPSLVQHIQQSFTATDTLGAFDVKAHVNGGGQAGQAGALRHAIARALVEADGQHRTKLRSARLMTRDPRAVERKKPGRPGARKRFQFSKR